MSAITPDPVFDTRPFCRDCLRFSQTARRCSACGAPAPIDHPERDSLAIAHVDCDAFFAAIEKRDDPSLADKPVIVGGGRRGVVSTCCYVARTYGVRSAMPMFKALKACPDAVVIRPDMEKYRQVGRAVKDAMRALTPLVESLSIDEAFLDLTGTERVHGASPAITLARFQARVRREIGISVSVGLSHNKFLAKIASDLEKPGGFSVIGRRETESFLRGQPVGIIWGVGKVMQERLSRDGIRSIADVLVHDEAALWKRYGQEGGRLYRLARGIDTRSVSPERETKSVSAETTFDTDISDPERLTAILWDLAEKVAERLRAAELCGASVTLKLKTADFRLRTRSRSGFAPTQLARRLHGVARELLKAEANGTAFRLIGLGVSDLRPADEADRADLLAGDTVKHVAEARAIEALRQRFGAGAIMRGAGLAAGRPSPRKGEDPGEG
jgi:DNA polymerase-4